LGGWCQGCVFCTCRSGSPDPMRTSGYARRIRPINRHTHFLNEEAFQMLSILAIAVYLSSLALIGYRVVKIRFAKYNKENMGLLGILALLSYTTIEPLLLSLFFTIASLVLLLLYIALWTRFSKRTR